MERRIFKINCHSERNEVKRRIYSFKTCSKPVIILLTKIDRFFISFRMATPFKFHDFCHSEWSKAQRRIYSLTTCKKQKELLSSIIIRFFTKFILSTANVFRMTTYFVLEERCNSACSTAQRLSRRISQMDRKTGGYIHLRRVQKL